MRRFLPRALLQSRPFVIVGLVALGLTPPVISGRSYARAAAATAPVRTYAYAAGLDRPAAASIGDATCDEPDLRNAIAAAASTNGTVTFTQDCSITLTAPLVITAGVNVALDGGGYRVILDGGGTTQLFVVQSGATLSLSGLTLAHGYASNQRGGTLTGAFGGAINNSGNLTILRSTLMDNSAQGQSGDAGLAAGGGGAGIGGAVYSGGSDSTLTIANSTLVSNTTSGGAGGDNGGYSSCYGANGGGVNWGDGNGCFYGAGNGGFGGGGGGGNSSSGGGSGGFGGGGGGTYYNGGGGGGFGGGNGGAISGGGGAGLGGAIFVDGGSARIINSSIVGNTSAGGRAGYGCFQGGPIPCGAPYQGQAGSGIGGGLYISGTLSMTNTIVANNTESTGTDIGGSYTNTSATNIVGGNASLGMLQDNGGPTFSLAPLHQSPAIGAGDPATCQSNPISGIDQRGQPRPASTCDIGAVDTNTQVFNNLVLAAPATVVAGQPFSVSVTVHDGTGATVSGYTGTVALDTSDHASVTLPAPYQFTSGPGGDNGTHVFSGVTLQTTGSQSVSAVELAGASGTLARTGTVTTTVAAPPTPTATPTQTQTPTATPTNTPTNTPTATSTPTNTPIPATVLANLARTAPFQKVILTGANFGPSESVSLFWDSARTLPLATTLTNGSGSFIASMTAPQATTGTHTIIAVGLRTYKLAASPIQIHPDIVLMPSAGAAGGTVVTSGFGFAAHEPVKLYWDKPASLLGTMTSNALGSFYGTTAITGTVPATAKTGLHYVAAVGQTSHAVGAGLFVLHS